MILTIVAGVVVIAVCALGYYFAFVVPAPAQTVPENSYPDCEKDCTNGCNNCKVLECGNGTWVGKYETLEACEEVRCTSIWYDCFYTCRTT